jgi:uncharacterized protein
VTAEIPSTVVTRPRNLLIFIVVTFIWSWSFGFFAKASSTDGLISGTAGTLIAIGSFGPLIGALSASYVEQGRKGISQLLKMFGPIKSNWKNFLISSYIFVPAIALVAFIYGFKDLNSTLSEVALLALIPLVALFSVTTGPLGEEFGWRGILLPYLIERQSYVRASLLVGLTWSIWHLPLWTFSEFRSNVNIIIFIPLYFLSIVALSFIMTWIYLRSNGSIAAAIIAHSAFNCSLLPLDSLREKEVFEGQVIFPFVLATVLTSIFATRQIIRRNS